MREFSFQLQKLHAGISPSDVQQRNMGDLYDALNLRATRRGIKSFSTDVRHIEAPVATMPYTPQGFNTSIGFVLLWDGLLGNFDPVTLRTDTTLGGLSTAGITYAGNEYAQVVDFDGHLVITTYDSGPIYRNWESPNYLLAECSSGYVRSACNYRGQLILGGMGESQYKNYVVWSPIGRFGLEPGHIDWLCSTMPVLTGPNLYWHFGLIRYVNPPLEGKPYADFAAGNRSMQWNGQVNRVEALDKGVVVYGDAGVSILFPATSPKPTFGLINTPIPGIIDRAAVCACLERHWCIDIDGYMWTIGNDFKVERIGYNRIFANTTHVRGFYDQLTGDVYFRHSSGCYILSDGGLTRIDQVPSSIVRYGKTLYMFYN